MIVWLIGLSVLLSLIIAYQLKTTPEIIEFITYDNDDRLFLFLINEHRISLGLNPLSSIAKLDYKAKKTVFSFPPVQHYNSLEIVGGGHQTLTALFRHYLNSLEHRQMIETENFLYLGIGIKKIENKYYNCTIFK